MTSRLVFGFKILDNRVFSFFFRIINHFLLNALTFNISFPFLKFKKHNIKLYHCLFINIFFCYGHCLAQKVELLKEISAYEGSDPSNFTLFKDKVYFKALEKIASGAFGSALWVTDGTTNGTFKIKACAPSMPLSSQPFITTKNFMFFIGYDPVYGLEPWVTDGSIKGTKMIKDVNPGGNSRVDELIAFQDKLYFNANDGINDALWVSDGTVAGTYKIRDFPHSNIAYITSHEFRIIDNKLFFNVDDARGNEKLWFTDGTISGTKLVNPNRNFNAPIGEAFKYKDKFLFTIGSDLNILDQDTFFTIGRNLGMGGCQSIKDEIIIYHDTIFFMNGGSEFYYSVGTKNGTKKITNVPFLCKFIIENDKLYFVGIRSSPEYIWTLNAGRTDIKPLAITSSYSVSNESNNIVNYNNKFYFTGYERQKGEQVFVFDPQLDTAFVFKSLYPKDLQAFNFFVANNLLYFYGTNPTPRGDSQLIYPGYVLWNSDGSLGNTKDVKPFIANDRIPNLNYLGNIKDKLFFGNNDNSFWYIEGKQDSARLIKPQGIDKFPPSTERQFILYKDYFIFRGNFTSTFYNDELWVLKLNDLPEQIDSSQFKGINDVVIYPNPTKSAISLNDFSENDVYVVEVLSTVNGLKLKRFTEVQKNQELDLSQLNNGFYIVRLKNSKDEHTVKKIIVNH